MRQALRHNPAKRQTTIPASIPAPTGGWDTESPLAKMPAKNAVLLDNMIPRASRVELRRGHTDQVSGFSDAVEALLVWRGDPTGDKMFACAGVNIYDVTTSGALGSAAYASATSARWEATNFANDGGAFMIAANGADAPIRYDGSAISALTITGTAGVITLDPTKLRAPMVHKKRIWFIEKETLRTWFLGTNAIQGAATLLDLGPQFYKGGHLVSQGTWSLDSGAGMDDVAVFVTDEGQIAVYQGLDPTDINQWSLVGVYDVARPVGDRCLIKWGADLAVITVDGVLPLSQALSKDREEAKKIALTAKISSAFSGSASTYGSLFGWGGITYSGRGNLAIFNVPTAELSTAVQYVQSIETGSWCRFTGLNAICWAVANEKVYFGGPEGVYRWDSGSSDNGETIVGDITTAFSGFGNTSRNKKFNMIRPLLKTPQIIKPALEMLVDYRESIPTAVATTVSSGDISSNDADAIRGDWTSCTGLGYVGAARMRVSIVGSADASLIAIDSDLVDLLLDESGGSTMLVSPDLPLDVNFEVIGFDLMFEAGGQL